MHILWVSPHCWPDYVLRSPGLGTKSQGGQSVIMYKCPLELTELYSHLYIDVYSRFETGEKKVVNLGERYRLIRCSCGNPNIYIPKEKFWYGPISEFVDNIDKYARQNKLKYDLIHGHYADGFYVARELARRWSVPYCLTPHSLGKRKKSNCCDMKEGSAGELENKYSFSIRIKEELEALKNAYYIFPNSNSEAEYIIQNYTGTTQDQIRVVPNGIHLSDFYPRDEVKITRMKKAFGIDKDDLIILHVGRFDIRKGQKELLEVALNVIKIFNKQNKKKAKFIFVGWDESEFSIKLKSKIQNSENYNSIIFVPAVPHRDIQQFYWIASVFVHASTYDIFPITVLEAMANRLAVLISRNCGTSEIITDGIEGLLINPFNLNDILLSLVKVLNNKKLREQLGIKAYLKISEHYTWRYVAKLLYQHYNEIIFGKQ